jgi:hypothetical protein
LFVVHGAESIHLLYSGFCAQVPDIVQKRGEHHGWFGVGGQGELSGLAGVFEL